LEVFILFNLYKLLSNVVSLSLSRLLKNAKCHALQVGDNIALRRWSGGDDVVNPTIRPTAAAMPPSAQPIPSVRWFVEDTTETETESETTAGIPEDLLHCVAAHHRALSLPNLADEDWGRKSSSEIKRGRNRDTAITRHRPGFAVATGVNIATKSLMTSVVTSSSHLKPPNSSIGTGSKMKRNKSFTEHPVITTVSEIGVLCFVLLFVFLC